MSGVGWSRSADDKPVVVEKDTNDFENEAGFFFVCVFNFSAVHAVGWAEAWCALRCCHHRPRSFLLFALRLYHKLFSPLRLQANLTRMGNTELTPPTSPTISPPKSPTGYVSVPPFPCPLPPPVLSAYLSRFLPSLSFPRPPPSAHPCLSSSLSARYGATACVNSPLGPFRAAAAAARRCSCRL